MCRKLTYSLSLVLMLGLVLTSVAGAADPDLLGWWPLNEGSGDTAFDLSSSAKDGTIGNATTGGLGPGGSVWFLDPDHGMVASMNAHFSWAWPSWTKSDPDEIFRLNWIKEGEYPYLCAKSPLAPIQKNRMSEALTKGK